MPRCKKRLGLLVKWRDAVISVNGWLHPRGCMGARYTHLDLEPIEPLRDLAAKRGISLLCSEAGSGVELVEPVTGISVWLAALDKGRRLRCVRRRVYLMRTRNGMIYVAPIELD